MANNHYNEPAFPDEKNNGLTKLEYAAIQLSVAYLYSTNRVEIPHIIETAKQLLTELEKSNQ